MSRALQDSPPLPELHELQEKIRNIRHGIAVVRDPLQELHEAIARGLKLTGIPQTIYDNLKAGKTVLDLLDSISGILGWLPGPIGTALKAINKVLHPIMRRNGPYQDVMKVSKQIADKLKPLQNMLKKIDKPVGKALDPLNKIDGKLAVLDTDITNLIARCERGDVPANTKECVAALSAKLQPLLDAINYMQDHALKLIRQLQPVLDKINQALQPVSDAYAKLESLLNLVRNKALQNALALLDKVSEPLMKLRKYIEWLGKKAYAFIKKFLHIDLAAVEKIFTDLVDKFIKPFRDAINKLRDQISRAMDQITDALKKVFDISPLLDTLADLQDAVQQATNSIESTLGGVCKSVVGVSLPPKLRRRG